MSYRIFILDQTGTGKSSLIKNYEILNNTGRKVKTAATTISASIRLPCGTKLHHLFALLDGHFTSQQIIESVSKDDSLHFVKETVLITNMVIIDEIRMLSRKKN